MVGRSEEHQCSDDGAFAPSGLPAGTSSEHVLLSLLEDVNASTELSEVIRRAIAGCVRLIGAESGVLALSPRLNLPAGASGFVAAGQTGQPRLELDRAAAQRLMEAGPAGRNGAAPQTLSTKAEGEKHLELPLSGGDGRLIGALVFRMGGRLDVQASRLLDRAARTIGIAIERAIRFAGVREELEYFAEIEREQRETQRKLQLVLGAGLIGTWEISVADGRIDYSRGMETILGLESGSYPTTVQFALYLIHPDDREGVEHGFRSALAGGTDLHLIYRIIRPGGVERWVESRGGFVRHREGADTRLVGVSTDITEQKKAEFASAALVNELRIRHSRCEEVLATQAAEILALGGRPLRGLEPHMGRCAERPEGDAPHALVQSPVPPDLALPAVEKRSVSAKSAEPFTPGIA